MNREARELERLRYEAWGAVKSDLRRAQSRVGQVANSCVRHHPVLVMAGGALLAASVVSMTASSSKAPRSARRSIGRTLVRIAQTWLVDALVSGLSPSAAATQGVDEPISPN